MTTPLPAASPSTLRTAGYPSSLSALFASSIELHARASAVGMPYLRMNSLEKTFEPSRDRKSTRLNSSHSQISYSVFRLKKKTIRLVLETEPRQPRTINPKVDRDLSTICLKCLDKDPRRRYASALALAEDLERWLRREPILARHTGIVTRGEKWLRRNRKLVATGAACLLVGAAVIWLFRGELAKLLPAKPPDKSIAVLPFVDLSQAKDQEYFCDGISEEILDALAKVDGLRVVARTSSFSFKAKNVDVGEVANKLNVENVLEGSLRREGNRIRITAQLINARDGFHLWSETYERELKDVFAVQDEITRSIVDALKIKLAVAPPGRARQN